MLEKGTITLKSGVFPKHGSHGTTQTCWSDTCEPEPCLSCKRGKASQNAEQPLMAQWPGTFSWSMYGSVLSRISGCCILNQVVLLGIISSCLGRTYGDSVIRGIWTSGLWEVTSAHIHCQRGASFHALFYLYC